MPSPFPGMDPYLENPAHWPDFHHEFISAWRGVIADRLPENYAARIGEQVLLVEGHRSGKLVVPDVLVSRGEYSSGDASSGRAAGAVIEPVTLRNMVRMDPVVEGYIEIVRMPQREVVTVLELFSPTNKSGDGRGQYIAKRQSLLQQDINLVELDLTGWPTSALICTSPLPDGHYYAMISRGNRRPECDVYAWSVRHPLPQLPVPLHAPDPDIQVDLAEVFRDAFDRGRYERFLDYATEPSGPLSRDDSKWAEEIARKGNLKS